jgi:hypothetical protein
MMNPAADDADGVTASPLIAFHLGSSSDKNELPVTTRFVPNRTVRTLDADALPFPNFDWL